MVRPEAARQQDLLDFYREKALREFATIQLDAQRATSLLSRHRDLIQQLYAS
jgi:hypothetical protein